MKSETIGGVAFRVVSEYEQKSLCFHDARLSWEDALSLAVLIAGVDAEKYVSPVGVVEKVVALEKDAIVDEEVPEPKKAKKIK